MRRDECSFSLRICTPHVQNPRGPGSLTSSVQLVHTPICSAQRCLNSSSVAVVIASASTASSSSFGRFHKDREIDEDHAASLIDTFKRGIRRYFKDTRLRASIRQPDVDRLLSMSAAEANAIETSTEDMGSQERSKCLGSEC